MSVDVVCFGETMALVAPNPPVPLAEAEQLVLAHAGAESNVAVSLARLGTGVQWCSRLGADPFGRRILRELSRAGVDTTLVTVCEGERTGVMFKDPGATSTTVHYYRDGSAASTMDVTDVDRALAGRPRLLHLSGITPALSASCAHAVEHAVGRAGELGISTSFDVNYRPALWPDPTTAAAELLELARRCDIVFVGLDEAGTLWGTATASEVRALIGDPAVLVVKDGARGAFSFQGEQRVEVPALAIEVLEAVGAGDAFAAGWLHAHLRGLSAVEALRLGHLVAAGSLTSATDHSPHPVDGAALLAAAAGERPWPPAAAEPGNGVRP